MATITCSTSRGLVYVDLNVTERSGSGSSATNKSTIDYSVVIRKGSVSWNTSWGGWGQRIYTTYYIEGLGTKTVYIPTYNYNGNVPPGSTVASGSFEIEHSNDGSKTISFNISFTDNANGNNSGSYYTPGNGAQVSDSLTLATIPRYTTVSTWSVASKTETSITLNWKTAETVKSIRYGTSTSSYSTATVDSTSGQVTITGLSANTGYTLYFMPCRKDSSLWGDGSDGTWKSLSGQSTYDWPKITGTPDFTIGTNFTVSLYNPLGRSCSIYLKGDNNSQGSVKTTTGTSITDFNNSTWKTFWYNSIPNKTGLDSNNKAQYKVRLVCSAVSRDTTVNGGYYRIKNDGTEIPNFSDSNWSYSGNLTSLVVSNQTIIKQYSTITFTVGTAATSSYGATIVKYVYKWGTKSKDSTSGNTVTGGATNILEVDAVDSRGLIKATTKTLVSGTNYVPYNTPTLDYSNSFTHRTDGISSETKLTLRGNLSVMKFGSSGVANAIHSAQYRVYDYSTNQWSGPYTIPVSSFTLQSSGYFSLTNYTIHANGSSGGFTTGKRYAVQIILKDGKGSLATLTSNNILVTDGKIARDVYQDSEGNYHQGINGMADSNYTEIIHGKLNVQDTIYGTGEINGNSIHSRYRATFEQGFKGKLLNGGAGTAGYMYAFDMNLTSTYMNQFIRFDILQRKRIGTVELYFNANNTVGSLSVDLIRKTGNINVYYIVQNNIFSFYIQKSEGYDSIDIQNLQLGNYSNGVNLTWKNQTVDSLPSGYITIQGGSYQNIDCAYPVGSIYLTINPANPSTYFGGSWTQLKNAFLFATNATSGTKGTGSGTGTSTGAATGNTGSTTLTAAQSGLPSHQHSLQNNNSGGSTVDWSGYGVTAQSNKGYAGNVKTAYAGGTNASEGHTHTLNSHTHTIPYLEIYVWKRTA